MLYMPPVYKPNFKRFRPSLAFSHESQRWMSKGKSEELCGYLLLRLRVYFTSIFDRYAYEHFDYVIRGDDRILSLFIASSLISKGYRVLLLPKKDRYCDASVQNLYQSRYSFCSSDHIKYVIDKLSLDTNPDDYRELLVLLSMKISEASELGALICLDANVGFSSNAFAMHNGYRQIVSLSGETVEIHKEWLAVGRLIPGVRLNYSVTRGENDDQVSSFICISTFESLIDTSPTPVVLDESDNNFSICFGNAKNPIDSYRKFHGYDRLNDFVDAAKWLDSIDVRANK